MAHSFINYTDAVMTHDERGGFLLNIGICVVGTWAPGDPLPKGELKQGAGPVQSVWSTVYVVCDEAEALDHGRTPQELEALAPSYREPE